MKNTFLPIYAILITALWTAQPTRGVVVDQYVAKVNDRVITLNEVATAFAPIRDELSASTPAANLEERLQTALDRVVDSLVEQALILEHFEQREDLNLPMEMIDGEAENFIRTRLNNNRALFEQALADEKMTINDWKEQRRKQMIVRLMRRSEVSAHVMVSPVAIRRRYEEQIQQYQKPARDHVFMISLNAGESADTQKIKQEEADILVSRIRAGEEFTKVAKENSEGRLAANGGDRGWISADDFREELAELIRTLPLGQVSEPLTLDDQIYIVMVSEREEASVKPLAMVRDAIENQLWMEQEEKLYSEWIKRLSRNNLVQRFDLPDLGLSR